MLVNTKIINTEYFIYFIFSDSNLIFFIQKQLHLIKKNINTYHAFILAFRMHFF